MNEYSLQGPFIYNLFVDTIKYNPRFNVNEDIESLRQELINNHNTINTNSFGATSTINKKPEREISDIAKRGVSNEKYSSLIYRLITKFEARTIWELGTSLGINTLYMSLNEASKVTTFEGCAATLDVAKSNFRRFSRKNITCIEGNIDDTIHAELAKTEKLDFVFFDANHRKEATLNYFNKCSDKSSEKSIFIFDDIHWSREMNTAWMFIQDDPRVSVTIDLFQLGLVFFDHSLAKEHFILSY